MSIITEPLKAARIDVTASHGVPFMVLYDVPSGLVEFYDLRYPMRHFNSEVRAKLGADMPGQFVSRYYVTTLLGEDEHSPDHIDWGALLLDGGVDDWKIDGQAMRMVRWWLRQTRQRATSADTTEKG